MTSSNGICLLQAPRNWSEAEHEAVRRKWDWHPDPNTLPQSQQPAQQEKLTTPAVQVCTQTITDVG